MTHIYNCKILNNGSETKLEYQKIYTGTINEQIKIFRKFERNMDVREKLLNEDTSPRDSSVIHCIPQSIVMDEIYIYMQHLFYVSLGIALFLRLQKLISPENFTD